MDIEYENGQELQQSNNNNQQQQVLNQQCQYQESNTNQQQNEFGFLRNRVGLEQSSENKSNNTTEQNSNSDDERNYEPSENSTSDEEELVDETEEDIQPINLEEYMKVRHLFQLIVIMIFKRFFGSIDPKEMSKFSNVKNWWSQDSQMEPLKAFNQYRVDFILKNVFKKGLGRQGLPLQDLKILDVGTGAGFLAESLSLLGGNVFAIDSCQESINQAQQHQQQFLSSSPIHSIQYQNTTLEQHIIDKNEKYDLVTAMEVIEHVNNQPEFLNNLQQSLNLNGLLFISSLGDNFTSKLMNIFLAEQILKIIPKGTHDSNKLINSQKITKHLQSQGMLLIGNEQLIYNPISKTMQ